jgi:tetratricopeptide (TPR) repeat protein
LTVAVLSIPIACGPSDPVSEATALLENGEVEAALEILRDAVEADPGNVALNHLYGRALMANDQSALAAWPLRRAAEDPEYAVKSGLLLTRSLLATTNAHEAVRSANAVLAVDPDNLEAVRMRAEARIGAKQEELAIEDLDRLIEAFPGELMHLERKLKVFLDKERFEEAEGVLGELAEAIEGRGDLPEGAEGLMCSRETDLEVRRGNREAATAKLLDCLERYPDSRQVVNQAMGFYDAQGDEERSTEILRDAIEARPADLDLKNILAERLAATDLAAATQLLQETAAELDTPAAWMNLQNHHVENDEMKGALESTDRLLQALVGVAPSDPEFSYDDVPEERLFESAVVVAITGDFARAEQMKAHIDEESHAHLLDARIHFERDELEEALDAWDEAFRLFPSNTGARHLAGLAALRLGRVERGIEHLRNALRTRAAGSDVGMVLAQVYIAMGNTRLALDSIFYHRRENPDDIDALRLQSRVAMLAGNEQISQSARAALAAMKPAQAVADQALEIEMRHGAEFALKFLGEGLIIDLDDPQHVDGLAAWVERMVTLDRAEAALARVAAVAEAHPDDANVRALYGATFATTGDLEAARAELDRALELEPDNHQALVALGRIDVREDDVDAAVERFLRAAKVEERDSSPIYSAVDALMAAGRAEEAHGHLEAMLRDRPWEGSAAHILARDALATGDHGDQTLAWAERAAAFYADPGSAAFETLGRVQLERGEPDAAIASLRRAASLGTPGPSGLYRIGTALSDAGDVEGAIRALETALTVEEFPEAADARAALAKLQPVRDG